MHLSKRLESILEHGLGRSTLLFGFLLLICLLALISLGKGRSVLPMNPAGEVGRTAIYLAETGKISRRDFVEKYDSFLEISRQNPGFVYTQDYYALGANGVLYPKHPILVSVIAAPFYAIFGTVGFWIYAQIMFLILIISFRHILRQFVKPGAADIGTIILIGGTQIAIGSFGLSYDLTLVSIMLAGLALSKRFPLWGSFLMGITAMIRASTVAFVPLLALAFLPTAKEERRSWIAAAISGLGQGLGLMMILNRLIWGSPFTLPYHRLPTFLNGTALFDHSHTLSLNNLLSEPVAKVFYPPHGMFPSNPALLLLPIGWLAWKSRSSRWFTTLTFVSGLLKLLVIFSYSYWNSSVIGNRFLLPTICLWLLGIGIGLGLRLEKRQQGGG